MYIYIYKKRLICVLRMGRPAGQSIMAKKCISVGPRLKKGKRERQFHSSSATLTRGCPVLYCVLGKTF
ncbi:hypothetical protein DAPPUDRAFT_305960 [Daphnia pulex]|uniref:Uncharacterized protein n=1 Tax=Daphnia pulex TaxID=6669 RepID=E9GTZ9_DAPPU|nr:hypothetical protein DAPPUDRAFT_305960 [Daphnia pulex]|eukprot:EFX76946.1 hypothetical protein DAPPUDRAFT_305960 [Daphnia pulex]